MRALLEWGETSVGVVVCPVVAGGCFLVVGLVMCTARDDCIYMREVTFLLVFHPCLFKEPILKKKKKKKKNSHPVPCCTLR
jgi:hypothetical protein